MQKTNYFSTACQLHLNERVCHEKCGLKLMQSCHDSHFDSCAASAGKNCRVCGCLMRIHYHIFEIPVEVEKEQEVVIEEMKVKYDMAQQDAITAHGQIQMNEDMKKRMQADIEAKKKDLNNATANLKGLCKNFNFHEELKGIVGNLEKEAQITRDFAQKKEYQNMAYAIKSTIA